MSNSNLSKKIVYNNVKPSLKLSFNNFKAEDDPLRSRMFPQYEGRTKVITTSHLDRFLVYFKG